MLTAAVQMIPEDADHEDPFWAPKFLELANMLIELGANQSIVMRYTGLSDRYAARLMQSFLGKYYDAPRIPTGGPLRYVVPSDRGGYVALVQASIFACCYLNMESAMTVPVHRGWLLANVFRSYRRLTELTVEQGKHLSLVAAYDLVTHLGVGRYRAESPLKLKPCPDCATSYLVLTGIESPPRRRACPMCAVNRNFLRMANSSAEANLAKRKAIPA
ncbi:MAG: hypothetical protein IPG34_16560 [Rhodocyclaceae bacterium]|nr:hypothetical protein [Rhodocyclaceae bacterium]